MVDGASVPDLAGLLSLSLCDVQCCQDQHKHPRALVHTLTLTAFPHTFKAVSFLVWVISSALKVQQLFLFTKNELMSSAMDLSLAFLRVVYQHDMDTFSQSSCFASLCFTD